MQGVVLIIVLLSVQYINKLFGGGGGGLVKEEA